MKQKHTTPLDELTSEDWQKMKDQETKEHRIAMWVAVIALLVSIICIWLAIDSYNSGTGGVVPLGVVGTIAAMVSLFAFFQDWPRFV